MTKIISGSVLVIIFAYLSFAAYKSVSDKYQLDKHYLDSLTLIKSRLYYSSSVDSRKEIEDYEDKIELYMHLDGYNACEILDMKVKAIMNAAPNKK